MAGAAAAAVLLATTAALLTGGDDREGAGPRAAASPDAVSTPAPEASVAAPSPAAVPASSPPLVAPERAAAVQAALAAGRTPEAARVALERVLAGRAAGLTGLLAAVLDGDAAAAASARSTLKSSGDDLERVVSVWAGRPLATEIRRGLDQQAAASRAYAEAVREGDVAGADRARADMGEVSRRLGLTLDRVTSGRIASYVPPQDAGGMRAYVDALAAGQDASAAETAQYLSGRLSREGAALAAALAGAA